MNTFGIETDKSALVYAEEEIFINSQPERVWEILTNISLWPSWQKSVTMALVDGDPIQNTIFKWKASGLSFVSKIHTAIPCSKFGWTGTTIGTTAIHNWELIHEKGGTKVVVKESLDGPLPRFFKHYFSKQLTKGLNTNLNELKIAAEASGEHTL